MKKLIALIVSLCMLAGMLPVMAETAAETPAEKEQVDMNRLIDEILSDIQNAVIRVDMEDLKANSDTTAAPSDGSVFAIMKSVLNGIGEAVAKEGKEDEDLTKLLALLNDPETAKNATEEELDVLSSLVILGIMAAADEEAEKAEEADNAGLIAAANSMLDAIYDASQANETLTAAVQATGSRLFEMLADNNKRFQEYVEKNGALDKASLEVDEKAYADFEAEIQKLEEYLKGIEGPKQSALDLVSLIHAVMDDIHESIDGHSHDDMAEVDHYALVGEMLSDLGEAINNTELDEIKKNAGDEFDTTGSVYAVFEKIIENMLADEAAKEAESEENLNQVLEMLSRLDQADVTEEEAEAVFALVFLGLAASEEEAQQIDPEVDFLRSSHILKATYDTMLENEKIKAALEAVDSRLPEMLERTGERMKNYLEENKTLHVVEDMNEAPFVAFEAEFAKLRDYIAGAEDGKTGKELALLDLLHEYVDDIHQAIDGHTHEDVAK